MAKDPYAEDIARLSTAKRTHFTHFQVGALPWHGEDHVFGRSTDTPPGPEQDEPRDDTEFVPLGEPGVDEDIDLATRAARRSVLDSTVFLVDSGKCYWCREPAAYGYHGKLYCISCWLDTEGDREDKDPYGGGA